MDDILITAPTKIVLAGRTFVAQTDRTFEQDIYLASQVRAAGLDQIPEKLDPTQPIEDFSYDILVRVFDSGRTFELLAGYLVEEGRTWSREAAAGNARFFAGLSDPAAKQALQDQIVKLVLAFFLTGLARTGISLRSFVGPREGASPDAPDSSAAASTSETGAPSSAS